MHRIEWLVFLGIFWLVNLGQAVVALTSQRLRVLGPQAVNLWNLERLQKNETALGTTSDRFALQDTSQATFGPEKYPFRAQWFRQPLDHFDDDDDKKSLSTPTFRQRYWVNSRHYKPRKGAPVIVLDGGETSGENRLPFLDTGIVDILARATGGLGVILEHRYYGQSIPVSDFSTDSLRFLNNEQAAADSANFMQNVKFDGISEDLTASATPWIYYGGSYAGARAAHMKILYPDLVWGAIASSAVTHASLTNWQYMDVIRKAADPACSAHLVNIINTVDNILANGPQFAKRMLKGLFGLADLEHDGDFACILMVPLESWQDQCWDPAFHSTKFEEFCSALTRPFGRVTTESLDLPYEHPDRMIELGNGLSVDLTIFNYGSWIKKDIVSKCPREQTTEECFGTYDDAKFRDTGLDQEWRLWMFQVCTQWGYFTTAPPDQKYPRIVSRFLTLGYASKICKQAFPPGKYFSVPSLPNVGVVNALGDFDISADRLAIIDGEVDPWKPQTPHSDDAEDREDTILQPFKLIPNAVHHYDEWGWQKLLEEPPEIRRIHAEMIHFVSAWLKYWIAER